MTLGYRGNSSPALEGHLVDACREGLRQRGSVEGRNLSLRFAWAEGHPERHSALAQALVRRTPDVSLTAGPPGTLAGKPATQAIPSVTAIAGDAGATGLVASLAKPGGTGTGLSTLAPELDGKRLARLREAVPTLSRVAVLRNPANPVTPFAWQARQPAAARGVTLQPVDASRPTDLERALARIKAAPPDGLVRIVDRCLAAYRASSGHGVVETRLPGMFPYREFAQEGGLMAAGPDSADLFRRAATYGETILKGAKAGDLPMAQPTKFELVLNLKTATALGVSLPQSILIRADEVLQ